MILFLPCHSTASGATVMTIMFGEAAFTFAVDCGTAVAAGKYIFDSHGVGGRVVLNSFFCACSYTLDVVAVDLVHDLSVVFPFSSVLHAALAGVKYFVDYCFLAGLFRDSVICQ